jgi:AcrR family transcriptional regulator
MAKATVTEKDRYHHGNLRASLLVAAEEAIREQGVETLSLREVARRAGVSHAAPYAHFKGRAQLLEAVALKAFGDLDQSMADAQELSAKDPYNQWLATGLGYVMFGIRQPQIFRLMWRVDLKSYHVSDPEHTSGAFSRLLAAMERIPGAPPKGTPAFMRDALLCWTVVHGLVELILDGALDVPAGNPVELARELLQRLQTVFQPPQERREPLVSATGR